MTLMKKTKLIALHIVCETAFVVEFIDVIVSFCCCCHLSIIFQLTWLTLAFGASTDIMSVEAPKATVNH